MIPLTVGSLFSGIGGFEFGLERTGGFKTVWQCEIDPFCLKVLEKHWPGVKRFADIKKMGIGEEIPYVDVICGGFPCQPVSCAGKRRGKEDERWLWPEFCRVVRCVRPEWVLVENVPGLLSADSGRLFAGILRDLSESGYDAEWNIVSAASVGAPHLRKRVFLVAHTSQPGRQQITRSTHGNETEDERWTTKENNEPDRDGESGGTGHVADSNIILGKPLLGNLGRIEAVVEAEQGISQPGSSREAPREMAHTICLGRHGRAGMFWQGRRRELENGGEAITDTSSEGLPQPEQEWEHGGSAAQCSRRIFERRLGGASDGLFPGLDGPWGEGWEDGVPRVVTGQKDRVNRLKALGNAIVPQCAQFVGQCLLDSIKAEAAQ